MCPDCSTTPNGSKEKEVTRLDKIGSVTRYPHNRRTLFQSPHIFDKLLV